jgi:hypothetical protein
MSGAGCQHGHDQFSHLHGTARAQLPNYIPPVVRIAVLGEGRSKSRKPEGSRDKRLIK